MYYKQSAAIGIFLTLLASTVFLVGYTVPDADREQKFTLCGFDRQVTTEERERKVPDTGITEMVEANNSTDKVLVFHAEATWWLGHGAAISSGLSMFEHMDWREDSRSTVPTTQLYSPMLRFRSTRQSFSWIPAVTF